MTELDCSDNQLTSLDLSKNIALEILDCADNKLMSLDVSKNTKLSYLVCDGNSIESLDISQNLDLDKDSVISDDSVKISNN